MALNVDFTFDKETYRHYMNGFLSVLHCHHYLCLTTKMAEDFDDLGGITILRETAEETIKPLFDDYIRKNNLTELEDRLAVGVEYYSVMGLGKMRVSARRGAVRRSWPVPISIPAGLRNGESVRLTTTILPAVILLQYSHPPLNGNWDLIRSRKCRVLSPEINRVCFRYS